MEAYFIHSLFCYVGDSVFFWQKENQQFLLFGSKAAELRVHRVDEVKIP